MRMQGGAGPPFRNPPSVWDVWGAFGSSLRVCGDVGDLGKIDSNTRAEPLFTATPESCGSTRSYGR